MQASPGNFNLICNQLQLAPFSVEDGPHQIFYIQDYTLSLIKVGLGHSGLKAIKEIHIGFKIPINIVLIHHK